MRGNKLRASQRGMVSFMVTLIMMLVISLIVLGFGQITRHNQQEALDRQLSSQAFYAAESGVNDAVAKIQSDPLHVVGQSSCSGTDYPATVLQADPSVSYTCVLVNPRPSTITTTGSTDSSAVEPLNSVDSDGNPTALKTLKFSWDIQTGGTNTNSSLCTTGTALQVNSASNWRCDFGLLRVDLVKGPIDATHTNSSNFDANTVSTYFIPAKTDSNVTISDFSAQRAMLLKGNCNIRTCSSTIQLSGAARSTSYYVRITTMYHNSPRVAINGTLISGSTAHFTDALAVVDVTGKAQDVLRRVQVSLPLNAIGNASLLPNNALQSSGDICKRFTVAPGQTGASGTLCGGSAVITGSVTGGPGPPGGPAHTDPIVPVDSCWKTPPPDFSRLKCWDPSVTNTTPALVPSSLLKCTWTWYYTTTPGATGSFTDTYSPTDPQCQTGNTASHQFTPLGMPPDGSDHYNFGCTLTNYFKSGAVVPYDRYECGGIPF